MAERLRYVRTSADPGGDGTTDTDSSGDGTHAYDSLSAAEAGERADLVTAGDTLRIVCSVGSGVAADTAAQVQFASGNWTTDATHFITIEPAPGEEAVMPWDATIYRLAAGGASVVLEIDVAYTVVRNLQVDNPDGGTSRIIVSCTNAGTDTPGIVLDGLLIRSSNAGANTRTGIKCSSRTHPAIVNCVVHDLGTAADSVGFYIDVRTGFEPPVYNCVAHGMAIGFDATATAFNGLAHCINCVAYGNGVNGFTGTFSNPSNNASGDATAPGANSLTSISDPFDDAAGGDFHLASGSALIGQGADLSGDADYPFATDFDGDARSSWDIGADEFVGVSGATGSIFSHSSPTLDGAAVQVGDGTVVARNLYFPSAEYATPFWVRPDGDNNRTQRVDSLPAQLVLRCGQIEVLSSAPV